MTNDIAEDMYTPEEVVSRLEAHLVYRCRIISALMDYREETDTDTMPAILSELVLINSAVARLGELTGDYIGVFPNPANPTSFAVLIYDNEEREE